MCKSSSSSCKPPPAFHHFPHQSSPFPLPTTTSATAIMPSSRGRHHPQRPNGPFHGLMGCCRPEPLPTVDAKTRLIWVQNHVPQARVSQHRCGLDKPFVQLCLPDASAHRPHAFVHHVDERGRLKRSLVSSCFVELRHLVTSVATLSTSPLIDLDKSGQTRPGLAVSC